MQYFNIANKIKNVRENLGLSQRELADKMGVPHSTIVRIESGEMNVSAGTLDKFCKATGFEFEFVNKETNLVFEVADYILDFCKKRMGEDYDVTNMKLNKLLYFVYSEYFKKFGESKLLFQNDFRAWEHGPIYLGVYHKYSNFKNKPIDIESFIYSSLTLEETTVIDQTLEKYYKKSAFELRHESHEDFRWINARKSGNNAKINF